MVAEAFGVDEADDERRGHEQAQHAKRRARGDLEVTPAEQPRGPRDADDGEASGGEAGEDPAHAAVGPAPGRARSGRRGRARPRRRARRGPGATCRAGRAGAGRRAPHREQRERSDPGQSGRRSGSGSGAGWVGGALSRTPSASSIAPASWVVTTTAAPSSRAASSTPETAAHVSRSCPTVGSSASTSAGPCAIAEATARRRCSPPESCRGSASARWAQPEAPRGPRRRVDRPSRVLPERGGVVSTSSRTVRPTRAVAARCGTHATTRARSVEDHSCGGPSRSRATARRRISAGVRGSATSTRPTPASQAAERSHEGGLAGPARTDERERPAGPGVEVDVDGPPWCVRSRRRATRRCSTLTSARRDDEPARWTRARGAPETPARGEPQVERLGLIDSRHPDPLGRKAFPVRSEHCGGRAVGDDGAPGVEDDEPVDEVDPAGQSVLDDDEREAAAAVTSSTRPRTCRPSRRRASRSARRAAARSAP